LFNSATYATEAHSFTASDSLPVLYLLQLIFRNNGVVYPNGIVRSRLSVDY